MSGERIKNAMTKLWKAMDTNGDGTVDVEECKKIQTEVQSKLTDAQKADPAFAQMSPESCVEVTKEIQEQTLALMASMPDELAKPMADMMEEIVSKLGNGESAATGGSEATSNGAATGGSEATSTTPCMIVDCSSGCTNVGQDDNGCGGTCECPSTTTSISSTTTSMTSPYETSKNCNSR